MDNTKKKTSQLLRWVINSFNKYFYLLAIIFFSFLTNYFPAIVRYNQNSLFGIGKGEFNLLFFKPFDLKLLWGAWYLWLSFLVGLMYLLKILSSSALTYYKQKFTKSFLTDWLISNGNYLDQKEVFSISEVFSSFLLSFFSLLVEVFSAVKINTRRINDLSTWIRSFWCLLFCLITLKSFELTVRHLSFKGYFDDDQTFLGSLYKEISNFSYSRSGTFFFVTFFFLNFDINPSLSKKANMINILLLSWSITSVSKEVIKFWKTSSSFITTYVSLLSRDDKDDCLR